MRVDSMVMIVKSVTWNEFVRLVLQLKDTID
jgi:hypothetical protein